MQIQSRSLHENGRFILTISSIMFDPQVYGKTSLFTAGKSTIIIVTLTEILYFLLKSLENLHLPSEIHPQMCPNFLDLAGSCFVAEFFYTFVLVFVVLNCAASKRTNPASAPGRSWQPDCLLIPPDLTSIVRGWYIYHLLFFSIESLCMLCVQSVVINCISMIIYACTHVWHILYSL